MRKNHVSVSVLVLVFKKIIMLCVGIIVLSFAAADNKSLIFDVLIRETIPFNQSSPVFNMFFKFGGNTTDKILYVVNSEDNVSEEETYESAAIFNPADVVGLSDIDFQPETDMLQIESHGVKEIITAADIEKLRNMDYLKNNFYIVDKRTDVTESDIDVDKFLSMDFKIDKNNMDKPKVLIFHTHSQEGYKDSVNIPEDGIFSVGEKLSDVLYSKYGITSIHHMGRYDIVDGHSQTSGAYERMQAAIKKILAENPSIEVVIDMHRDALPEDRRIVKIVGGKNTAQIMFVNGLSQTYQQNKLTALSNLPNPFKTQNLAFSFMMQLSANAKYPEFTRKIYLNAYRYSLFMAPKSLLIEVGAQTNTKEEALNAVEPLAEILADVILY